MKYFQYQASGDQSHLMQKNMDWYQISRNLQFVINVFDVDVVFSYWL